jgi:hypothetical protein
VTPVIEGLRSWAQGAYGLEAAVELLARAHAGRFAERDRAWVVRSRGSFALDVDALAAAAVDSPYSGGERRLLAIAASLAAGLAVDLSEVVAGLDRHVLSLVLAAVAHAGGGHETGTGIRIAPDGLGVALVALPPICPWPTTTELES